MQLHFYINNKYAQWGAHVSIGPIVHISIVNVFDDSGKKRRAHYFFFSISNKWVFCIIYQYSWWKSKLWLVKRKPKNQPNNNDSDHVNEECDETLCWSCPSNDRAFYTYTSAVCSSWIEYLVTYFLGRYRNMFAALYIMESIVSWTMDMDMDSVFMILWLAFSHPFCARVVSLAFIAYASTHIPNEWIFEGKKLINFLCIQNICFCFTVYINFTLASFSMHPRQFHSTKCFRKQNKEHKTCAVQRMN